MARYSMDLTRGSVLKKLIVFAFPICLSNLVQQLYHTADVVVVGNFARNSTVALAAVGSTSHVTTLLVNLFVGLSVGANVLCSNRVGAGDREGNRRAIHTAIPLSLVCGLFISFVGFFLARPLLELMGSPADVIDQATLYMKIIFIGQPASIVYNFGSGILRAHGDTRRPMYILTLSGLANVLMNFVFVTVFHLDAAGVALATTVAHYLSAYLVLHILFHREGEYRMKFSEMRILPEEVKAIAKIGLPAGVNGMVYSISNVIIISTLNSLGSVSVAASSAATSVSSVIHTAGAGFATACTSFAGQNYGAGNLVRIRKLFWYSMLLVESIFLVICTTVTCFPEFFLRLFTSEEAVIREGIPKMLLNSWGYMLNLFAEVSNGCLRGMRRSNGPTLVNMATVCTTRLVWVIAVFPFLPVRNLGWLAVCYPVSWFVSGIGLFVYFSIVIRKEEKKRAI